MSRQTKPREAPEQAAETAQRRPARWARDHVRAVNPENGLEVVFKPGELLPDWAKEEDE